MRICAYLPIYKRKDLLAETFSRLKNQTHPFEKIVAVGSCDEDKEIAKVYKVDYISSENQPLSNKIQLGVEYLHQFKPDAIMGIGSDDWPTENWVEELSPRLGSFDVVGSDHFYLFLVKSKPTELIRYHYPSPRYGEPMGAGRFISRRILDKFDWKLYPPNLNRGLDGASYRTMQASGAKSFLYKEDKAKILSPKGIPGQLTTWAHATIPYNSKKIHDENWINRNFPGLEAKGLL